MFLFYERMRNADKKGRYSGIDASEVAKWRTWRKCYEGFFADGRYDIESLFTAVGDLVQEFGYT